MSTEYMLADCAFKAYPENDRGVGLTPAYRVDLKGGVSYAVFNLPDAIVVAVVGSESEANDWVTNFRVSPWYSRHCGWCHAGWLKASKLIADSVKNSIKDPEEKDLYFVGHSKGGAECVLAAQIASSKYKLPVAAVRLYGGPKPFIYRRTKFKFLVIAYKNYLDPVPATPLLYRSAADEIELGGEAGHSMGSYRENIRNLKV